MPILSDIVGIINKMSPTALAESWDNPGVQVGDPYAEITRIMVALDATSSVIQSAIDSSCQLLITHHPMIFSPQKSIIKSTPLGEKIHNAICNGLSIFAMHTNYDIVEGGLNDLLADIVGLVDSTPLQVTYKQELSKLVLFVPKNYLEKVRTVLFQYAEVFGAYQDCSYTTTGEGTFTPKEGAKPFIGSIGKMEIVAENRLELLVDKRQLPKIIKVIKSVHPYEEPAFDIYPLLNEGSHTGLGRIGKLNSPVTLETFAKQISTNLLAPGLRYVGNPDSLLKKVAICSGSGSSLMRSAVQMGADVLLTGDVKYHEALDAEALGISLIDVGHYSTEIIMVEAITVRLQKLLENCGYDGCMVLPCKVESDPFRYLTNIHTWR